MYVVLLAELKAQEGYSARERRTITVRGATDAVPLPSWMSASQAAGRGGCEQHRLPACSAVLLAA